MAAEASANLTNYCPPAVDPEGFQEEQDYLGQDVRAQGTLLCSERAAVRRLRAKAYPQALIPLCACQSDCDRLRSVEKCL